MYVKIFFVKEIYAVGVKTAKYSETMNRKPMKLKAV
jgi:hypothetical protein